MARAAKHEDAEHGEAEERPVEVEQPVMQEASAGDEAPGGDQQSSGESDGRQGVGDGVGVGRIVHYVLSSGANRGQCRPAMVVRIWSEIGEGPVQLQVFLDGTNDRPYDGAGMEWQTSVLLGERCEPGTWHWPRIR